MLDPWVTGPRLTALNLPVPNPLAALPWVQSRDELHFQAIGGVS